MIMLIPFFIALLVTVIRRITHEFDYYFFMAELTIWVLFFDFVFVHLYTI